MRLANYRSQTLPTDSTDEPNYAGMLKEAVMPLLREQVAENE